MVRDRWAGHNNALCKEQLLSDIEAQMDNEEELLPEDQFLMEINLGDINQSLGDAQVAKTLAQETQGVG